MLSKYKNSKVEKTCHIVFFLCGWRDERTGVQCFSYIVDLMYTNISFAARPVRLAVMQLLVSVSTFKTVILFLTNINVHVDTRQI
jgi:hypothetical protein